MGFDDSTPRTTYVCPRCAAILGTALQLGTDGVPICEACKCRFLRCDCVDCEEDRACGRRTFETVYEWLRAFGFRHEIDSPLSHSRALARAVTLLDPGDENFRWHSPAQAVYTSLAQAQAFVHFTTWGLSEEFLGALKLIASKGVVVRGIVSAANKYIIDRLDECWTFTGCLNIRAFAESEPRSSQPHFKLLVVDGLLAFEGSANLTTAGWRKIATYADTMTALTSPGKVAEQNNRFFAKAWREHRVPDHYLPQFEGDVYLHNF